MPPRRHRGTTTVPVTWKLVKEVNGNRYFEGVAYSAGIKGQRKRVTCSDQVWNCDDDNVFYHDESVRFTVEELSKMNLMGTPIRIQHNTDLPPVGSIVHNWTDKETGFLHIIGEIPSGSKYGQAAISLVDNGTCSELSISYPLERNPVTREVTHLAVDEVSVVTKGHFDKCRINIRASKRSNHKVRESRTEFRTVKAMSAPPAAAAAATDKQPVKQQETKEDDPTANMSPEDIVKNSVAIKKKLDELAKEKHELEERAKKAEDFVKKVKDAEEKARQEYAEKHAVEAEEVTQYMMEILEDQGLDPAEFTDDWKQTYKQMLTADDSKARQTQAVQVSAARGYRAMKARLAEVEARNGELEKAVQLGAAVLNVEEDDLERHERRDLKAAARNTAAAAAAPLMAPDEEAAVEPPAWLVAMTGGRAVGAPYKVPTQQRQLTAAASKPPTRQAAPSAAAAVAGVVPQQRQKKVAAAAAPPARQQQQQQQAGPKPLRPGYPVNEFSFRNLEYNKALWDFSKDVMRDVPLHNALAPIAGADFERREGH